LRFLLRSKIHRAYVTHTNPDYIGSIAIDQALMDKADLWEYEKVLVCDVTNGNRWETYVLAAEPGTGTVSVQGAGALLCEQGDCVIILAFEASDEPVEPKMILVDRDNRFVEYLEGAKHAQQVH
jgi:aspartate 1-decarboxylase